MSTLTSRKFRADDTGPSLLVTGGVHGDEFEPIFAIRRLIRFFSSEEPLTHGRLTLVPVVNEAAFLRGHRCAAADGLDLARTCPGRRDGSPTEQVAAELSELIRASDYYIDLHTGVMDALAKRGDRYVGRNSSHGMQHYVQRARCFD